MLDSRPSRSARLRALGVCSLLIAGACGGPAAPPERPRKEAPVAKLALEEASATPVAAAMSAPAPERLGALMGDEVGLEGPPSPAADARKTRSGANRTSGFGVIGAGHGGGLGSGYGGEDPAVSRPRRAQRQIGPAALPMAAEMNTERYAHANENRFARTEDAPLSTFSIDVDTASYSNVRRFLKDGVRPPVDSVRIEELVNYFSYDDPAPAAGQPFSVATEVTTAPWNEKNRLLRIGLRTRAIDSARAPASNLVFLIDVSGSMETPDKLPLLSRGLSLLANNLRAQDRVAIVVYAGASGLVLPSTPGSQRAMVLEALERLRAGGSTNGGDGIRQAYEVAQQHFVQGGVNRVILATDGDFNVGTTSEGELVRLIEDKRKSGVFLTVLGFGRGNLNDSSMEKLADHGNGNYAYVDSIAEAQKVLVREAGSTLVTVAKDVKLQIEWNPKRVASYRLIGFENRVLAARDFNDDQKDAGEIGAGHSMTALYEVVPRSAAGASNEVDPLKYQADRGPTAAADSDELLTVKLRYKRPDGDTSALISRIVRDGGDTTEASTDLRWAAAVACFGMLLRDSEHKGDATLALADRLARSAVGADPHGQRHEFIHLIEQARDLGVGVEAGANTRAQVAR